MLNLIIHLLLVIIIIKGHSLRRASSSYIYIYAIHMHSFVQNDVSQDKELNRRIGLATITFGKLKSMVFTSKKVSLRV